MSRVRSLSSPSSAVRSLPPPYSSPSCISALPASRSRIRCMSCTVCTLPARPSTSSTARLSSVPSAARHWSSRLSASRRAPFAIRARISAPSGCRSICSAAATCSRCFSMSRGRIRLNENRWHRERIVAGTLCSSVVARMNTRCSGGSSRIFSSALNAGVESMCTSSMMYTRFFSTAGV